MDDAQLTLDLDGWEGPLDLLLSLARGQKVDLRKISILALVEQYLAYVDSARALKLELAADYLVMAAWQAEIFDLIAAYGRISARTRPVMHVVADREVMTLEAALERVSMLVGERIDWSVIESFLPEAGERLRRSALASSFVAALELARQGKIELRQASPFAPLYLRARA